jgi:hypothetical protein
MKKFEFSADVVCTVKDGKIVGGEFGEPNKDLELAIENVEYEILNESGPGGGWPEILFRGYKNNLKDILKLLYTGNNNNEFNTLFNKWDGSFESTIEIIG